MNTTYINKFQRDGYVTERYILDDYEMFIDPCYYDMWAVRPIGNRNFNDAIHVVNEKEALRLIEFIREEKKKTTQALHIDEDEVLEAFRIWKNAELDKHKGFPLADTEIFIAGFKAALKTKGEIK